MTALDKLDFPITEYEQADDEVRKFSVSSRPRAEKLMAALSADFGHFNVRESQHGRKTFMVIAMRYADTVLRIAGI